MTEKTRTGFLPELLLLAGLYLTVAVVVVLGISLFLPVALALDGHVNTAVLIAAEFIAVGSVPGIMIIYYCLFTLRRSTDDQSAIEVSPGEAPELWAVVTDVAKAVGTRPPARLRLSAMANAAVFEETRLLGFVRGRRSLMIGLPLALGLTTAELQAVLAHEFGHYARGHTRLGAQVYLGSVALRHTCQALRAARESDSHRSAVRMLWRARSLYAYLAYLIFSIYSALYDRVSFAARRRQELQADAYAAENFGRDVTANALRAAHALPEAWSRFQVGFLEPMRKAGYVPDEPLRAFEVMLCDPDYRDVLAELRLAPSDRPVSRLDSHPTLAKRLAALPAAGGAPRASLSASASAGAELLKGDQWLSVSRRLRPGMFSSGRTAVGTSGQELTWREWVRTAAALRAAGPAADLIRISARQAGEVTATLDTVLNLLAAGCGHDLAADLAERDGPPGRARAVLAGAVYALTGHYFTEAGRADWAVSWTGPSRLIAAGIGADELSDLVTAAVHQPAAEVARLRLYLASLGIDPAAVTPVTSLLRATTLGADGLKGDSPGSVRRVRIRADAYQAGAQRLSTIRVMSVAVGLVTGAVALAGIHAWNSSHSPPSYTPIYAAPVPIPSPLTGITVPSAALPSISPVDLPSIPPVALPSISPLLLPTFVAIVQPGDSLSALACRYATTVVALQRMNHLGQSTLIFAGQRLKVPSSFGITGTCTG